MSSKLHLSTVDRWTRTPYQVRSLWLQQALDAFGSEDLVRVEGDLRADIVIVGGGYVGLWTAWYLKEADPAIDVVIVDADIASGGASGRNSGQILPLWSKIKTIEVAAGRAEAGEIARASESAIDVIEQFAISTGSDIGFDRSGWLWLASSPSQLSTWDGLFEACAEHGATPFTRISEDEANARSGSKAYLGGVFMPNAAVVQPALLGRALRRELIARGVRVYEESPVLEVESTPSGATVITPGGRIRTGKVIMALGGWSGSVPELRTSILTVGSEIIATEPIPDALDASGWTGNEPITNARLTLRYTRRTDDGRATFGRAGTSLAYGRRVSASKFEQNPNSARALAAEMARFVPAAAGAKITHAWIGPVDRSHDGLPSYGRLAAGGGRILYASGFSGNGVGPAIMAAQSLTSLALGHDDEHSTGAFVQRRLKRWPPEPARYFGGEMVRVATTTMEGIQEQGKKAPRLLKAVAKLAPGGLGKDDTKRKEPAA